MESGIQNKFYKQEKVENNISKTNSMIRDLGSPTQDVQVGFFVKQFNFQKNLSCEEKHFMLNGA